MIDYYEKLEEINNRLAAGMAKYAHGIANDAWRKNFLKSLSAIKKMQASDAVVALGAGRGDAPFGGMVKQVKARRDVQARVDACSTLQGLNGMLCKGIPMDQKVCDGISGATKSLACHSLD